MLVRHPACAFDIPQRPVFRAPPPAPHQTSYSRRRCCRCSSAAECYAAMYRWRSPTCSIFFGVRMRSSRNAHHNTPFPDHIPCVPLPNPANVPELLIVYPFSGHLSDPGLSRNLASSSRLRTDLHPDFEEACAPVLKRPFCVARRHHSLHTAPARVHLLLIAFPAVLTTLFSRASVSSPPAPQPPSEQRRPWHDHHGR